MLNFIVVADTNLKSNTEFIGVPATLLMHYLTQLPVLLQGQEDTISEQLPMVIGLFVAAHVSVDVYQSA